MATGTSNPMAEQTPDAQMGAPGAEHGKFEPFVGTFRAQVKLWMGPGDPMVSTGTMHNTMILGGRFLGHDYKGDPGEGPSPAGSLRATQRSGRSLSLRASVPRGRRAYSLSWPPFPSLF